MDGAGTKRLFGDDLGELEELLGDQLEGRPRFSRDGHAGCSTSRTWWSCSTAAMVPPDSVFAAPEGLQGVTVIEVVPGELDEPRGGLSVGRAARHAAAGVRRRRVYDGRARRALAANAAEALARQLAPLRIGRR